MGYDQKPVYSAINENDLPKLKQLIQLHTSYEVLNKLDYVDSHMRTFRAMAAGRKDGLELYRFLVELDGCPQEYQNGAVNYPHEFAEDLQLAAYCKEYATMEYILQIPWPIGITDWERPPGNFMVYDNILLETLAKCVLDYNDARAAVVILNACDKNNAFAMYGGSLRSWWAEAIRPNGATGAEDAAHHVYYAESSFYALDVDTLNQVLDAYDDAQRPS